MTGVEIIGIFVLLVAFATFAISFATKKDIERLDKKIDALDKKHAEELNKRPTREEVENIVLKQRPQTFSGGASEIGGNENG